MTLYNTDNKNFKSTLEKLSGKVVVKFGAEWCSPCKTLDPLLVKLSETVNVITVDVDESPELSDEFNIRAVPTVFLFEDGVQVDRKSGGMTKSSLDTFAKV